jgi:hypothetical protein
MSPKTVRGWVVKNTGRSHEELTAYIRIDKLLKLSALAEEGFSPPEIETHVTAIKGYGCSLPALGTHLPFVENAAMVRLLLHFIGDGFLCSVVGSTKVSAYTNQNAQLRKGFISCLTEVFGNVSLCVSEHTDDKNRPHVRVSKWISYLLTRFYPDAVFGQTRSELPKAIFSASDNLKIEAIRTLADDDGSVQELCIRFVSGSSVLLENARRLVLQLVESDSELAGSIKRVLKRSVSTVRKQLNWYRLDLGFRMFEWYRDRIGFSHPEKSRELDFRIDAAKISAQMDALARDYLICSDLMIHEKTPQEIAVAHNIREEYVHASLRYHASRGRVVKCGKSLKRKKASTKWALTDSGRKWVYTLDVVNKCRSRGFMREALPHRDYMRYRWLKPTRLGVSSMSQSSRETARGIDRTSVPEVIR